MQTRLTFLGRPDSSTPYPTFSMISRTFVTPPANRFPGTHVLINCAQPVLMEHA